ncbi:phosphotransfer domain-containing protein [Duganella sp. Leaf126]|uniref:Hpt domain-containing protein n=1 Tax=Duganella sp. Leaf126 TaxID=1736266 RepID=UPI0006FD6D8B|nr:Hpt domain-containing protein [Duganella sp. Leaf126]KQQ31105.1 phosphotransfer domain-containing protein [Duganella sp. Leaf126]
MSIASFDSVPVLEVATGLQQLMDDHDMYRQVLRRFRQRYRDSAEQARTELLAGDAVSAQRTVHTLKGAAGMIGAHQLHHLSMALEPLFAGPPAQCIGPLAQLEQTLRTLMAAIDTELAAVQSPPMPPSPAPSASGEPGESRMLVQHLARLLDEGDGQAVDLLERSAAVLEAALGEEVFRKVAAAVHQFDFEAALAALPAPRR